ncbi:oxidoreductase [Paenibacillus eucommiae]|uniref:Uncharacterized protein YbjT (DUF2867 family) n=1 Tax=Paenibacillus eucommiae TaxID=1355755 RepID=A0ABS4ITJ7_9BACL|nr:oxidoreductase [Paenibacillus eucommiae]MBP1990897.1 uncharacterized protein YbjT (DUF2867 family) [Paenibacillus eucommiae]
MTEITKTAVIAGASGLIGKELLRVLLHDESYGKIIILVRKMLDVKHLPHSKHKLEQRVIDFAHIEAAVADCMSGSYVFCTLGTTIKKAGSQEAFRKVDYEYPLSLGRISAKAGAAQFCIVTAMGASSRSGIFYNKVKGQVEDTLQTAGLQSLHIFRPSLLLGEREEKRAGEQIASVIAKATSFAWIGPLARYKPIYGKTVALAMVASTLEHAPGVHVYPSSAIHNLAKKSVMKSVMK